MSKISSTSTICPNLSVETTRKVVPTDKLGQIVLVEDILDIIYEVLLGIEEKMETFVPIKPDFDALEKRQKMGELYPKD
jgi:hypothetical protein